MPRDNCRKHALPMTIAIACAMPNHSACSDIISVHKTSITDRGVCLGNQCFYLAFPIDFPSCFSISG